MRLLWHRLRQPPPNDPIWRGFSASRDAIQKARKVDLTLVSKWEFEETEWKDSIDGCVDLVDITQYRKIYFGWTYTLTSMRGQVYQTRVSYDLKEIAVCDKLSTAAAPTAVAGGTPPILLKISDYMTSRRQMCVHSFSPGRAKFRLSSARAAEGANRPGYGERVSRIA